MSLIQHDEDYDTLRAAADAPALVRLAQADPHLLEDAFLARVQGWIAAAEAAGNTAAAQGLGQRLAVLQELRRGQEREAALPPIGRALMAFIRAADDEAAAAVFGREAALLDSETAARALENSFRSDDAEGLARIAARAALLAHLRRAPGDPPA